MKMKQFTLTLAVSVMFQSAPAKPAVSDIFGSGADAFEIEFVTIGDPGNTADTAGIPNPAGSVPYTYRIGKYEVSTDMINKANVAGELDITFYNWWEPNQLAFYVSWFESAIFVNWLNESTQNVPAYKFDSEGNFQLWAPDDPGYDPTNPFRNTQTRYVLPNVDEWYKAAYYDPENEVYYKYPTGSNTLPDGIDFDGDTTFDAVFNDGYEYARSNDIMDAGVLSPYGTMAQGGNGWEWQETEYDLSNDSIFGDRMIRGIDWDYSTNSADFLRSSFRAPGHPETRSGIGLRVASLFEPSLPLAGDFNEDGQVDGADLTDPVLGLSARFGVDLDGNDFLVWQRQFGSSLDSENASVSVPEPVSLQLLLLWVSMLGRSRWFEKSIL